MSKFKQKMEHAYGIGPDTSNGHTQFMAGARAALELAADDLIQHDTHRYAGRENLAYNAAMDFVDGQLRTRAKELSDG